MPRMGRIYNLLKVEWLYSLMSHVSLGEVDHQTLNQEDLGSIPTGSNVLCPLLIATPHSTGECPGSGSCIPT